MEACRGLFPFGGVLAGFLFRYGVGAIFGFGSTVWNTISEER